MKKILYIEDMKSCYDKTSEALGKDFEIDWKQNYSSGIEALSKDLNQYSAGVFDVNLDYNPELPNDQQTREGLELIKLAKQEREKKNLNFPIICASSNGTLYEKLAIQAGADIFLWKKEFWEGKGKKALEELIKKP
jgi:CheY-like chemotaxis protein